MTLLRFFYFLLFPIIIVYPNGLLKGTYLNYVYVVFVFMLFLILKSRGKIKINLTNTFFFLLFFIVVVSNFWSSISAKNIDLNEYLFSTLRYFSYFLIATILTNTTKNEKQFKFWVISFFVALSASILLVVLDSFGVEWVERIFKVRSSEELNTSEIFLRAYGAFLSPVSAGIFILNGLVLAVTMLFWGQVAKKYYWLVIIFVFSSIFAIFSTASRTALVGLGGFSVLLMLSSKNRISIFILSGLFVFLVLKTGLLDQYLENITIRNEAQTAYGQSLFEGSGRYATVVNSIRLFFNERTFFFGVGPTEYSIGDKGFSLAHNGILSLIFCYGFFGFILFSKLIVTLFNKIFFNNNLQKTHTGFSKSYFILFLFTNLITFISSDGPVTHFWLLGFLFFLFFIENINKTNQVIG